MVHVRAATDHRQWPLARACSLAENGGVPDEDVMTWRELVRPDEVAGVTVAGSDAVRWAVDVHERFFGDAWLLRADTSDNRIATIVSGPLTGVVPNTSTTTELSPRTWCTTRPRC